MGMSSILGRKRKLFTKAQKQILMERFQANKYLLKRERRELAMSLNIEEKRIDIWYFNMHRKKAAFGAPS